MKFRTLAAIFFASVIIIFSLQKAEVTDVKFLIWKLSISRVLVILGSFVLGLLVGILIKKKKRIHY